MLQETIERITRQRIEREERAAERAKSLATGEYYALDGKVVNRATRATAVECESHWDACLVLLAVGRA